MKEIKELLKNLGIDAKNLSDVDRLDLIRAISNMCDAQKEFSRNALIIDAYRQKNEDNKKNDTRNETEKRN